MLRCTSPHCGGNLLMPDVPTTYDWFTLPRQYSRVCLLCAREYLYRPATPQRPAQPVPLTPAVVAWLLARAGGAATRSVLQYPLPV